MLRRGISPVIATVIIVAVAVAISIAVVGWIMGLWGSIAGGTESLKIYPDSYINVTNTTIYLHIANTGSASAVIYKIEIAGVAECTASSGSEATLNPGDDLWLGANYSADKWLLDDEDTVLNSDIENSGKSITCTSLGTATPGAYYLVKVYTKAGNVYQANVIAK